MVCRLSPERQGSEQSCPSQTETKYDPRPEAQRMSVPGAGYNPGSAWVSERKPRGIGKFGGPCPHAWKL